jgi:hypothetical protein
LSIAHPRQTGLPMTKGGSMIDKLATQDGAIRDDKASGPWTSN